VGKDEFGHTLRRSRGGIKNEAALSPRIVDINVVHAHAATANHAQTRAGIDQFLACGGRRPYEEDLNALLLDEVRKLFLGHLGRENGVSSALQDIYARLGHTIIR